MSLSFYGKIVLKVLKCEDRVSLGDPVCLIAGLCLVIAAALPLQNHVSNYPLLFVMYYAGLLGFILGFALLRVKELLKKKLTLEEVEKLLKNRDSLCAAMVFGLFFSFFYSMAFKYGKLSIPLGGPTDYHIWGANVDVFLGHVSDKAMELSGRFYLSRDYEIGTLITLGFLSVAKGMTGLEALPSISILMYSLLGAGIFKLVKRVTGSSFWMGILISFGVLSGYLFNVVLLMGSYAQFIGTISYLAAVFGLFNCVNTEKSFREKLIPIVFPFLLLSICYTGVLIVFYSFFYLIGFIYALFLVREGLNTIVYRIKEVSKLMFPAVVAGILPFFVFLWIPYLMIQRFMALKGHIVEGLTLPNFNTFVFSGFPGFSLPLVFTDFKMSVFTFTVLIAVTLALFRLSWKTSDNAKRPL
jgi:hypothetical protein